ncbi:hypothetical protein [Micromonospora orduensis]|uniref:hypothetical protein n=1 Tax=Micromonospora orduensis TaxID=1420891 RepID=UPI00142EC70A|nr:hypothetical protein [Micromonospora orduensis]
MRTSMRDLTDDDRELIEYARQIVDANTDGVDGIHTVGAAVGSAAPIGDSFSHAA